MERAISIYLQELGYNIPFSIKTFRSWMHNNHMWAGYDKVKNREDLNNQRVRNLIYSIVNSMASDLNEDLESFSWWCSNLGYDEDSRKAERIFNLCREIKEKICSLNLCKEQLEFLNNEALEETGKFQKEINNLSPLQ